MKKRQGHEECRDDGDGLVEHTPADREHPPHGECAHDGRQAAAQIKKWLDGLIPAICKRRQARIQTEREGDREPARIQQCHRIEEPGGIHEVGGAEIAREKSNRGSGDRGFVHPRAGKRQPEPEPPETRDQGEKKDEREQSTRKRSRHDPPGGRWSYSTVPSGRIIAVHGAQRSICPPRTRKINSGSLVGGSSNSVRIDWIGCPRPDMCREPATSARYSGMLNSVAAGRARAGSSPTAPGGTSAAAAPRIRGGITAAIAKTIVRTA